MKWQIHAHRAARVPAQLVKGTATTAVILLSAVNVCVYVFGGRGHQNIRNQHYIRPQAAAAQQQFGTVGTLASPHTIVRCTASKTGAHMGCMWCASAATGTAGTACLGGVCLCEVGHLRLRPPSRCCRWLLFCRQRCWCGHHRRTRGCTRRAAAGHVHHRHRRRCWDRWCSCHCRNWHVWLLPAAGRSLQPL